MNKVNAIMKSILTALGLLIASSACAAPQLIAHRGGTGDAPENTLPAFQKALEMGVDGIELDVHLSADGDLVVIHDFTVDKTTRGSGRVETFTTAQLAALDAGSHFSPTFAGVGVPTLADVLDLNEKRFQPLPHQRQQLSKK